METINCKHILAQLQLHCFKLDANSVVRCLASFKWKPSQSNLGGVWFTSFRYDVWVWNEQNSYLVFV